MESANTTLLEPTLSTAVWTIQMAKWRKAKACGVPVLDITARGKAYPFAPDYALVMDYKAGVVSQQDYTAAYLERMAFMQKRYEPAWQGLLKMPTFAAACFCPAGVFCHRHLFVGMLPEYFQRFDRTLELRGELT